MPSHAKTVICDNGSGFIKAQIVGNEHDVVFPNIVGNTSRNSLINQEYQTNNTNVGHEAISNKRMLRLTSPMTRGVIHDFDKMEKVWEHTFYEELKIDPKESNLIITEPASSSHKQTLEMVKIMFDNFEFPSILLARSPVLSLYSVNRLTGIAVDIGDSLTQVVAVNNGVAFYDTLFSEEFGGSDITDELEALLAGQGHNLMSRREVNHIKETYAYVAQDYDEEEHIFKTESYPLPDGNMILLKQEPYKCAERLFRMKGLEAIPKTSISRHIVNSIFETSRSIEDVATRQIIQRNIVLGGGSTLFRGLVDRITTQLLEYRFLDETLKVYEGRGIRSAMIGGRMVSLLPDFHKKYLSHKWLYEERGEIDDVFNKRI